MQAKGVVVESLLAQRVVIVHIGCLLKRHSCRSHIIFAHGNHSKVQQRVLCHGIVAVATLFKEWFCLFGLPCFVIAQCELVDGNALLFVGCRAAYVGFKRGYGIGILLLSKEGCSKHLVHCYALRLFAVVGNKGFGYLLRLPVFALFHIYAGNVVWYLKIVFVAHLHLLEPVVGLLQLAYVVLHCSEVELRILGASFPREGERCEKVARQLLLAALLQCQGIIEFSTFARIYIEAVEIGLLEPLVGKLKAVAVVVRLRYECRNDIPAACFGVVGKVLVQQSAPLQVVGAECGRCVQEFNLLLLGRRQCPCVNLVKDIERCRIVTVGVQSAPLVHQVPEIVACDVALCVQHCCCCHKHNQKDASSHFISFCKLFSVFQCPCLWIAGRTPPARHPP